MPTEFAPGSTRDRGAKVETLVATEAERRGLTIVARNVEAGGVELDIVARQGGNPATFVFIEVRSRVADDRGRPVETVGARKQARLVRGATAWLVAERLWEKVAVRFDVVGVTTPDDAPPIVEWIENAFDAV